MVDVVLNEDDEVEERAPTDVDEPPLTENVMPLPVCTTVPAVPVVAADVVDDTVLLTVAASVPPFVPPDVLVAVLPIVAASVPPDVLIASLLR